MLTAVATSSYRRVAEVREPIHNRLLCKVYLDTGMLEIGSRGTLFQFDVRSLLLHTQETSISVPEISCEFEPKEMAASDS